MHELLLWKQQFDLGFSREASKKGREKGLHAPRIRSLGEKKCTENSIFRSRSFDSGFQPPLGMMGRQPAPLSPARDDVLHAFLRSARDVRLCGVLHAANSTWQLACGHHAWSQDSVECLSQVSQNEQLAQTHISCTAPRVIARRPVFLLKYARGAQGFGTIRRIDTMSKGNHS